MMEGNLLLYQTTSFKLANHANEYRSTFKILIRITDQMGKFLIPQTISPSIWRTRFTLLT